MMLLLLLTTVCIAFSALAQSNLRANMSWGSFFVVVHHTHTHTMPNQVGWRAMDSMVAAVMVVALCVEHNR